MTQYRKGTVLFAIADASERSVQAARDYCKSNAITPDDAAIVKSNDTVCVRLKQDFQLPQPTG